MEFINPPPFGEVGDFSNNPIYTVGSTVNVVWTSGSPGVPVSICLFQLNGTEYLYPFEYLTQSAIDRTNYRWLVGTDKDISVLNMFYLSIFEEGNTTGDSNSHYFYIEESNRDDSETTSASVSTTSSASASTTSVQSASLTPTNPISSTPASPTPTSSSSPATSGGLATGGIIGISVGIALALILGAGAGWFFFGRRRKRNNDAGTAATSVPPNNFRETSYYGGSYPFVGYTPQMDASKIYHPSHQTLHEAPPEGTPMTYAPHELPSTH